MGGCVLWMWPKRIVLLFLNCIPPEFDLLFVHIAKRRLSERHSSLKMMLTVEALCLAFLLHLLLLQQWYSFSQTQKIPVRLCYVSRDATLSDLKTQPWSCCDNTLN